MAEKVERSKAKKMLRLGMIAMLIVPTFFAFANARILASGKGKIFGDVASVPHHRVGIVLGCAPTVGQFQNPFFLGRIQAAAELYRSGKVDRLLVSGDNGSKDYDEPTAMEAALVAKGVPIEHITKDSAGFRTLDTMVRAHEVFGLTDAVIITDDFHMARSLYFASGAGILADGYPSKARLNSMTASTEFREVLARGRAVLDQDILHAGPKFLGKQETIR